MTRIVHCTSNKTFECCQTMTFDYGMVTKEVEWGIPCNYMRQEVNVDCRKIVDSRTIHQSTTSYLLLIYNRVPVTSFKSVAIILCCRGYNFKACKEV